MRTTRPTSSAARRATVSAALVLLTLPAAVSAGVEVRLELPVRAKVDLTGRRTVTTTPFLVVGREGAEGGDRIRGSALDVQKEFERYLAKLIRRETDLKLVESGPVDYPTFDLELLAANRDFWRALGERTQADLVLAGSLDFDVQDKSGYRTEEYVSPFDGRTYYRQVLVEQTGFDYDIVLMVFDGRNGERLYFDNFKDFKQFEGERTDPLQGMFENLASLEDRIVNVFTQKTVETTRILFDRLNWKEAVPVNRSALLPRLAAAGLTLTLALSAPPTGAQTLSSGFGKNKIQYREFDWKIYHSPHFDVYHYAEGAPLLEKVVSMAESAYDRLSREFDHQIQDPVPLIYYVTHSQFEQNNIIPNFIPEGIGAFASPVRNRMVLPVDLPDGELFELVMHELTHVFQYSAIYQGKFGRGIAGQAPQWFMEGMASYMAKDEGTVEKMFLRDAVVNDAVPSILQRGTSGYMAYRFGHAAFDYIEERWGKEGFRDFVYEFRNTIGGRTDRALERSLRIEPEEFDLDFRRWLRKQYLPELVEKGEPSDFGRPFRDEKREIDEAISPAASPSGDLVAALTVTKGDLDVMLFDGKKRRPIGNLTKGFSDDYQYLVSQHLTSKARMGRDLAFSPDGNLLALFAKRERGRSLVLVDVLKKKTHRIIDMDVEQQHAPAWSPDGKKLAFAGNQHGAFDIFVLDLESGAVTNLTQDPAYDGAPVFAPNGAWIVYSSAVGGQHAQLFRIQIADTTQRERLSMGEWNDKDAIFGSDGKWLYFTSDRSGTDNIWGLEIASGKLVQFTNAVTGCFMPTVLKGEEGRDRIVYTGFWRGTFDLYLVDLEQPVTEPTTSKLEPQLVEPQGLPVFEPDIQVTLDSANQEEYKRSKLFLEDGGGTIGVTDDQYILGGGYLSFSDYLGDRRLIAAFSSVDTFSNFDVVYLNQVHRWNWALELFDNRSFYVFRDPNTGRVVDQQAALSLTGLVASYIYPINFYNRVELGGGFILREYDFTQVLRDESGNVVYAIEPRKDEFPIVQTALVGDSVVGDRSGPVSGQRYRLRGSYGYDTDGGGALSTNVDFDYRRYFRTSERTSFAVRAFGGWADGSFPSIYSIGGLDTLRGVDFRSLVGDRAFFVNLEWRFPLVDALIGPVFDFRGIRGRIFLDVGGAWRDYAGEEFDFWDSDESRLQDGISAYGWGFTVQFAGFDLNWDFAQRWDFKDAVGEDGTRGSDEGFRTAFWIGSRF